MLQFHQTAFDGVDDLVVVALNPQGVDLIIDKAADTGIPFVFANRNPFSADNKIGF